MNLGLRVVATACLILGTVAGAEAGVTKTVVDLPSALGTMRFLHVRPDAPIATIVQISGADGNVGIADNGEYTTLVGTCGPISRNVDRFAARGIAVVVVNARYPNMLPIVDWLRARESIPIWPAGGSAGADAANTLAVQAQVAAPVGVLFGSPAGVSQAHLITGPALVIYHAEDTVTGNTGQFVYNGLTSASVRELVILSGGGSPPCGTHALSDLDTEFVDIVADFIDKYNPTISPPPPPPPVPVPGEVIEYFHAGFGHYFVTAQADEIAGLDGGAFGGAFARTGRSFRSLESPTADTVPVCRFFTVTFAPKSSHFYTADAAECEAVKLNPDWQYEKIAFHIRVPAGGTCPGVTVPVYRMYNNGQTGAPNHRFTTDAALYQQFTTAQNWSGEGIAFCGQP